MLLLSAAAVMHDGVTQESCRSDLEGKIRHVFFSVPFEMNVAGILVMQNRAITLPETVLKLCRYALYFTQEPFADTPKPVILRRSF